MKWLRHKNLSEDDLELLRGTPLMERLQANRLVVVFQPEDKKPAKKDMGLRETQGLFHIRNIGNGKNRENVIEILFENPEDVGIVEEHLTQVKLAME